jgi:serine/threonine protein kinase
VVRVHDFGQLDDVSFISMEYVEGVTLRNCSPSGVPPLGVSLRIARQVAAGLAAAHGAGVVHYDLKPENVVFEPGGNAKLMDFGLSRIAHHDDKTRGFAGTLGYASPEVMRGAGGQCRLRRVRVRCDISRIALGPSAWSGSDPRELVHRILHDPPAHSGPARCRANWRRRLRPAGPRCRAS